MTSVRRSYIEHGVLRHLSLRLRLPQNDYYRRSQVVAATSAGRIARCSLLIEHHLSSNRHRPAAPRRSRQLVVVVAGFHGSTPSPPSFGAPGRRRQITHVRRRLAVAGNDSRAWFDGCDRGLASKLVAPRDARRISRAQRPADHQINPACMLQVVGEMRTRSQRQSPQPQL